MSKRILAFAIVAVMLALTACTAPAATPAPAAPAAPSAAPAAPSAAPAAPSAAPAAPTAAPAAPPKTADPVKLKVEVFDRNNIDPTVGTVTDNPFTKYIKEGMLAEGVDVSFEPVPRGEETQKITVLMASGTAPDIIFTYDRSLFQKFAMEGGLHDLTPYIDQYGQDLKAYTGEISMPYGVLDGKQYAFPALRVRVGHITPFIRSDWVTKAGVSMPTNRDELVTVLKAFKEKNLGANGLTIPWGGQLNGAPYGKMQDVIHSFGTNEEEYEYTVPKYIRENYKEAAKWMAELYKEGLIDPEFATRPSDQINNPIKGSNVGFFMEGNWVPHGLSGGNAFLLAAQEIDKDAMMEAVNCFPDKNGKYYKMTYTPTGLFNMVPLTCKNPEAAVKYLNWMCRKENAYKICYGDEGTMYKIEDGVPINIVNDDTNKRRAPLGDLALMFNGGWNLPIELSNLQTEKNNPKFGKQAAAAQKMAEVDGVYEPFYNVPIAAERQYLSELDTAAQQWWVKLVTEPDFEKTYADYIKDMEAKGIKEIQKEYTEYYAKYMKK